MVSRMEAEGSVEGALFDLARSDSEEQEQKWVPRKQVTGGRRERGGCGLFFDRLAPPLYNGDSDAGGVLCTHGSKDFG